MEVNESTYNFIWEHKSDDVHRLALSMNRYPDVDAAFALQQIEARQRIRTKLPEIYASNKWILPPLLSLEQCSSEATAQYKSMLIRELCATMPAPRSIVDLTGGFGIDFHYCSQGFDTATYVEQKSNLCDLARHNLRGEIVCTDSVEYLQQMSDADIIMIDPARRDNVGRKVAGLQDCTPDLTQIYDLLLQKSKFVVVKLSPMLDWREAVRLLPATCQVHIVSVKGECKELLLILSSACANLPQSRTIHCIDLPDGNPFIFAENEMELLPADTSNNDIDLPAESVTDNLWLYEPNASVMKAGSFRLIEQRFSAQQLAANSHLFVSRSPIPFFPGRSFIIRKILTLSKQDQKYISSLRQANVSCRNFPQTPDELRKKLRLKDGGDIYLFFTTDSRGKHIVLQVEHQS